MRINLIVNGTEHTLEVEPRTTLLDCLREHLGLKGAHVGCETVSAAPAPSCLTESPCVRA
jgi:aerobic-type carbon monoxide dehydrogenase small subunit (CoxS/CutS family)